TIAKLRALRRLWARVEEACGLAPAHAFVAAESAWRMMGKRDPYLNMVRATIAALAAGVGGADAITLLPFTLALGLPDRFARRADALIGTSDFADLAQAPVTVLDARRPMPSAAPRAIRFEALPSLRLAEPFEELRDASDRLHEASGSRPKIFLACLGKPADF